MKCSWILWEICYCLNTAWSFDLNIFHEMLTSWIPMKQALTSWNFTHILENRGLLVHAHFSSIWCRHLLLSVFLLELLLGHLKNLKCFISIFVYLKVFLICLFIYSLTHWLLSSMLFMLHIFVSFPVFFV